MGELFQRLFNRGGGCNDRVSDARSCTSGEFRQALSNEANELQYRANVPRDKQRGPGTYAFENELFRTIVALHSEERCATKAKDGIPGSRPSERDSAKAAKRWHDIANHRLDRITWEQLKQEKELLARELKQANLAHAPQGKIDRLRTLQDYTEQVTKAKEYKEHKEHKDGGPGTYAFEHEIVLTAHALNMDARYTAKLKNGDTTCLSGLSPLARQAAPHWHEKANSHLDGITRAQLKQEEVRLNIALQRAVLAREPSAKIEGLQWRRELVAQVTKAKVHREE